MAKNIINELFPLPDDNLINETTDNILPSQVIDHSQVSITAGDGLSGGGSIVSTRTISNSDKGTTARTAHESAYKHDLLTSIVDVKNFGAIGDGAVDDTTAIQNAINSLTTGGTVYLPGGVYKTTAKLIVNVDNITLKLDSNATIAATHNGNVIEMSDSNRSTHTGTLSSDANRNDTTINVGIGEGANFSVDNFIVIRESGFTVGEINRVLKVVGDTLTLANKLRYDYDTVDGAEVYTVDLLENISIEGGKITTSGTGSILISGTYLYNFQVKNVRLLPTSSHGILISHCYIGEISGNHIEETIINAKGILGWNIVNGFVISNNRFSKGNGAGIYLGPLCDANIVNSNILSETESRDVVGGSAIICDSCSCNIISNNKVDAFWNDAIVVDRDALAAYRPFEITISNNIVTGNQGPGIIMYFTDDSSIIGNICSYCGENGIITVSCGNILIVNNQANNNGNNGTYDGIRVSGPSTNVIVNNNISSYNTGYGLSVDASSIVSLGFNRYISNSLGDKSILGSLFDEIENNIIVQYDVINGTRMGVGDVPDTKFHIIGGDGKSNDPISPSTFFLIDNLYNTYFQISSGADSWGGLLFADPDSVGAGAVFYDHSTDTFQFNINGGVSIARMNLSGMGWGVVPLESIHGSGKVRANTVFNTNGTDGLASQVVALAKITPTGTDGSITVTGGIITAYTAPT